MITKRPATVLTLLAALAMLGPVPDAHARGAPARGGMAGGAALLRGGGEKKKKKKKRTADQRLLDAVASQFQAEDYTALGRRMPGGKSKMSLRLGDAVGRYQRASAEGVLKEWFRKREIVLVKRTSNDGLVGEFELTFRRTGRDEKQKRTLTIGLRRSKTKDGKEVETLVQIEVHGT